MEGALWLHSPHCRQLEEELILSKTEDYFPWNLSEQNLSPKKGSKL